MTYNTRTSGRRIGDIDPLYWKLTSSGVIKEKRSGEDRRKSERRVSDVLERTDPVIGNERKEDRRKESDTF